MMLMQRCPRSWRRRSDVLVRSRIIGKSSDPLLAAMSFRMLVTDCRHRRFHRVYSPSMMFIWPFTTSSRRVACFNGTGRRIGINSAYIKHSAYITSRTDDLARKLEILSAYINGIPLAWRIFPAIVLMTEHAGLLVASSDIKALFHGRSLARTVAFSSATMPRSSM